MICIRRLALLCCLLSPGLSPSSALAQSGIIDVVRAAIAAHDLKNAEELALRELGRDPGHPEALAALSWAARGALAAREFETALRIARDTERRLLPVLKTRGVDANPNLAIAMGAALEVQAQATAAQGNRSEAVHLLTQALTRYGKSSIRARLQKNVHLLSLVGKPMPALDAREHLGSARFSSATMQGKPLLLFFWAHWCSDCKAMSAIVAKMQNEFMQKGLVVVAPTQRYGYIGAREHVPAAEERRHIDAVRQQFYPSLASTPIPLAQENFATWGVSTTPTLALVDRTGVVRLYNPGSMTEPALRDAVTALLSR